MKTLLLKHFKTISRIGLFAIAMFASNFICRGQQVPPWQLRLQYPDRVIEEETHVLKDLYYSQDSSNLTTLDLYLPGNTHKPDSSIVFLIHGWFDPETIPIKPSNWQFYIDYGKLLASRGFATVVVNHRMNSKESTYQSRNDIESAIIFIQNNYRKYGLTAKKISLWFFSMGAIHFEHFVTQDGFSVHKMVSFYGFFSAANENLSNVKDYPKMLIVRCGKDSDEIIKRTDNYLTHCLGKNYPLELINIPNGLHGFELLQDQIIAKSVIDKTVEFLKSKEFTFSNKP
jgi:hypothetical protein